MSKRIIFVLVVFVYFLGFNLTKAEVIINEVMYAPTQNNNYNEWLEIYNNGSDIDLTNLLVCDKPVIAGYIKHSDGSLNQDNGLVLGAGEFAIITDGGSGTDVYDNYSVNNSSFALHISVSEICGGLTNSGKEIEVSDSIFNYTQYIDKANGDGNSLQLVSGSWVASSPTPGAQNQDSGSNENNDTGGNDNTANESSSSSSSSSSEKEEPVIIPVFKAKILAPSLAFAGQTIEFNLDVKDGIYTYASGKYFWNFGDGTSKEENVGFQKFNHTYYYPGEYNVSLEYYKSNGSFEPDATAQIIIKVVPMTVSISKVGDYKDFFIELTNNSDSKIDISKWVLSSNSKFFIFPKNTTIAGKKSLTVSGRISGFIVGDENSLKLAMPTGEIVFDYNTKSAPVKKVVEQISSNIENKVSSTDQKEIEPEIIVQNNLAASAVLSDTGNSKNQYLFIFGLVAFLGICGGAVYFLRRNRRVVDSVGDDFDILDE